MKLYSLKISALTLMVMSTLACSKQVEFAKKALNSNNNIENPGECDAVELAVSHPTQVKQDEVFSMSVNRLHGSWTLDKGAIHVGIEGANVTTSLSEVGVYSGFLVATNSCGEEDGYEFFITVVEKDDPVDPVDPVVTGKADILFVVHNTQSMFSELRETIPYRFKDFIKNLKGDYRIGVTTGDISGAQSYEAGGLAEVLRTPVSGPGIVVLPRQNVITPAMGEYTSRNFLATIMRPEAICIQVETRRCPFYASGYQQGITAAEMAINRSESQVLFRNDAPLHVVIIADRDQSGNDTQAPERFIAAVQAKWPGKKLKVHTVIFRPEDRVCNANHVDASKAPIYSKLTKLTGGVSANFCDNMDRSEIKAIADEINK